jgi:Domain of unknown function (DUF4268)
MPLFQVSDIDGDGKPRRLLVEKQPLPFASEQLHERRDLQPLLRDKPDAIDPDLMIISEEFGEWDESGRRIDLLGLDRQGHLVVIELKRVEDGGHMELQALRYAAMVSTMDLDGVVRTYAKFLKTQGGASENADEKIKEFLKETAISTTPRIVLVAPSFSKEITTAVLWLNDQGLKIRCVAAKLYNLDNQHYLNIEQVIPLPSASDYQIRIREKQKAEQQVAQVTKGQLLHLQFWTQFKQYLDDRGSPIHMGKPSSSTLGTVTLGRSPFRLIPWNVLANSSGVWVRFTERDENAIHEKIAQEYRHQVEEKLSPLGELIWVPSDAQGSLLSLRRSSTLSKPETWQELNQWMAQALKTAYELFSEIVTKEGLVSDSSSDVDDELAGEHREAEE